jgi:hypothetical protein
MEYEEQLDKIFANGRLWKHRTFRTVLDPLSHEYSQTTMDQKINFLKTLINSNVDLSSFIMDYKIRYSELDRRDIAVETEKALLIIVEHLLKKDQDEANDG